MAKKKSDEATGETITEAAETIRKHGDAPTFDQMAHLRVPEPILEQCGNCHFWRDRICKFFPHAVVSAIHQDRPTPGPEEWCGQWKLKVA